MDVIEVFVEVDSACSVSSGGGEREHEVWDGSCPGVQNPKATSIKVELLCNKEGMMREDWDTDGVG